MMIVEISLMLQKNNMNKEEDEIVDNIQKEGCQSLYDLIVLSHWLTILTI